MLQIRDPCLQSCMFNSCPQTLYTSPSEITLCIYLYAELLSVSPAYKLQEGRVCNLSFLPFKRPEQGLMYIRCSINTDGKNKGVMVMLWKLKRWNSSLCIRIGNIWAGASIRKRSPSGQGRKDFPGRREQNGGMQEHGRVWGNPAARVVIL